MSGFIVMRIISLLGAFLGLSKSDREVSFSSNLNVIIIFKSFLQVAYSNIPNSLLNTRSQDASRVAQ